MNLLSVFNKFISEQNLFLPKDKLLLAVSGGLDSIVLCELCYQSGFDFAIAHCNFQLRGEESERDENFLKGLAEKYQKEIFIRKFDTEKYAVENKVSIQVAARALRYSWFEEIASGQWSMVNKTHNSSSNIHHVATAHHLNDNIETLLMNFFKGTGIAGLHGILPRQGNIVRPLLFAKKDELKEFALAMNLQWVEDSSNESDKYSRNYLRHHVIPLIEKIYPAAIDNLSGNIDRFRDIEILYHQSIALHKNKLLEKRGEEVHIAVLKLRKSAPLNTIVYEIIREFGFFSAQVDETISLLDSESGKYIQSPSHRILKNRKWFIISPNNTELAQNILIDKADGRWPMADGELLFEKFSTSGHKPAYRTGRLQTTNSIAQLDAGKIKLPLLLRKWKRGDYFYPLGMKKKKKLARFFIDNKLSQTDKEKVWVMEMNKKIIWIVGMRIDERFKVTEQTKEVLKIVFNKL